MTRVVVRPARQGDVEACARLVADDPLWRRYGVTLAGARKALRAGVGLRGARGLRGAQGSQGRAGQALGGDGSLVVATLGGQVVGFIAYHLRGAFHHSGYIRWITVAPHARGRGVGRRLMRFAEERIFKRGPNVFLMASDFNEEAHAFYRKQGYTEVGAVPDYMVPGITERLYRKTRGPIAARPRG